jgi:tripartite-type tricarboxylate transporter receptor subunit TctC
MTQLKVDAGIRPYCRIAGLLIAATTFFTGLMTCLNAQSGFPTRAIRIMVPYGAGGVGDVTMRILAQKMTEHFGKQVIIENRPGAGGLLAAKAVLDASPDGYTLLEAGNGAAIGMSLFKNRPYNILQDFTSISMTASFDVLIATPMRSKYETLKDIVEAASKTPGKLNFGAINPGSTQNLSAHMFKQLTGIDVTIVPFRTTPDLVTALLRNDVDVGFDYYARLPVGHRRQEDPYRSRFGRKAASPSAERADVTRQRVCRLCRDRVECPRRTRRASGRRAPSSQS